MTLLLPFTSTPSAPPSLGPVATCASDGADPAAPAGVSPTLPRGVIVEIAGKPGQWRVRGVSGGVVDVVGVGGQGFAFVGLDDVRRV